MQKKIKLKIIDYIIGILFAAVAAFSVFHAFKPQDTKVRLIISAGKKEWVYPLDSDRELGIQGVLGVSRIRIKNGQAEFLESPCSNQVCVHTPPLRRNGDWAACLPNQVFIYVEGTGTAASDFDAVGF